MLRLPDAPNQVSSVERPMLLFHCPVAKGCAAGFFYFQFPDFHLLSFTSLMATHAGELRERL